MAPLQVCGVATLLAAVVGVTLVPREPSGIFGLVVLAAVGVVGIALGWSVPTLTPYGRAAAENWRRRRAYLARAARDPSLRVDFEADLPCIVAFGLAPRMKQRFERESKTSSAPVWLDAALAADGAPSYRGWTQYAGTGPVYSGGGGGFGGGASAGGGGASGSF